MLCDNVLGYDVLYFLNVTPFDIPNTVLNVFSIYFIKDIGLYWSIKYFCVCVFWNV